MARQGITFEQVSAAIDELIAAGANPTIQGVRDILGTGSPNTIHRHLTAWRAAAPVAERKSIDLPHELKAALVAELERQAAAARAEVEKDLANTKEEAATLAETGEVLEAQNADLLEEIETVKAENEKMQIISKERDAEIQKLRAELAQERHSAEALRVELAKEQLKTERLAAEEMELKKLVDIVQAKYEQARDESRDEAKRAAVLDAKLESAVGEINDLKSRLSDCVAKNENLASKIENIKSEHAEKLEGLNAETRLAKDLAAKLEKEKGQIALEKQRFESALADANQKLEVIQVEQSKTQK